MKNANAIQRLGTGIGRYSLVVILLLFGALKFTQAEMDAIQPFIEHSPLMSWLPEILGLRVTSGLIGVTEIAVALLIASRRFSPRLSAIGSLLAAGIFVVTTSFMVTTPDAFAPGNYLGAFLLKDWFLMALALCVAGEAWEAHKVAN